MSSSTIHVQCKDAEKLDNTKRGSSKLSERLSKLRFKNCYACITQRRIQNETHLAKKVPIKNPRAQDRRMKIKMRCKRPSVSGVQCCCPERRGKCAVWRSGVKSGSQETGNENFMVTINPPFVFEVLTLHSHTPRCDCFGKYLYCQRFYNWGLKRAEVTVTCGFCRVTGQESGWEFARPGLARGAWVLQAARLSQTIFLLPSQTLSAHAPTGIATNSSPYASSVSCLRLLLFSLMFSDRRRCMGASLLPVLLCWCTAVHKNISLGQHKAHLTSSAPSSWLPTLFEGAHVVVGGSMTFRLLCLVICELAGSRSEGKQGQVDTSFPQRPGKWETSTRIKSRAVLPLRQSCCNKMLLKSSCPSCVSGICPVRSSLWNCILLLPTKASCLWW